MKYLALLTPLFALAGFAFGQNPPDLPERLSKLQRDLPFIEMLVDEGITLASLDDPLKRAQRCNVLAEGLVKEIQRAAGKGDEKHSAQLGKYLQSVLVRGVAGNLDRVRTAGPGGENAGSPREPEMRLVGAEVLRLTRPVTEYLYKAPEPERRLMKTAAEAAGKGRIAVENALHGPGKN